MHVSLSSVGLGETGTVLDMVWLEFFWRAEKQREHFLNVKKNIFFCTARTLQLHCS